MGYLAFANCFSCRESWSQLIAPVEGMVEISYLPRLKGYLNSTKGFLRSTICFGWMGSQLAEIRPVEI